MQFSANDHLFASVSCVDRNQVRVEYFKFVQVASPFCYASLKKGVIKMIEDKVTDMVAETTHPVRQSAGVLFADTFEAVTSRWYIWANKKKIQRDQELEQFREEIQRKVSQIPDENIQEPKMNIVGPAIAASEFCFEEPHYKEMFSNLIASAFDSRQEGQPHPFFVEAIKQLTPEEAWILSLFQKADRLPIAKYSGKVPGGGEIPLEPLVFFPNTIACDPRKYSASLINLQRLGFLEIDLLSHFTNDSYYSTFENDPTFIAYNQKNAEGWPFSGVEMTKGIVVITPLGRNFLSVCLPDEFHL